MFCSNCGKEIPEGQTSCPECGTPIPKSVTTNAALNGIKTGISTGTDKLKNGINSLGVDPMKLISLIGSVLILLAPFFHWISMKIKFMGQKEKEAENLFGLDFGMASFTAVIMIIVGIILIVWEVADLAPALANIKEKIKGINGISVIYDYIPLILVGVVFLFVLLTLLNGDYRDAITIGKDMFKAVGAKGHVNRGLGPIVAFFGMIASAFPKVIEVIKK